MEEEHINMLPCRGILQLFRSRVAMCIALRTAEAELESGRLLPQTLTRHHLELRPKTKEAGTLFSLACSCFFTDYVVVLSCNQSPP